MRFHNVNMVGSFILQRVSTLPASATDARLVYNEENERIYYKASDGWKDISSGGLGTLKKFTNNQFTEPGYLYSVDTSISSQFGYTTSNPTSGDSFSIIDYAGNFSTNNLTVSGAGYSINGQNTISFNTDDTIANFVFLGNEWKVDIGGLSTSSAGSSGVNFSGLSPVTEAESDDLVLIYDISDFENKKLTTEQFFGSINNLNELSSSDNNDYLLVYDTSENEAKKLSATNVSGSGGISYISINANNMILDDENTESNYGSIFGLYQCVNFPTTEDGSVWISGKFPDSWDTSEDLSIDIVYSMNGNDPSKTVRFNIDFWSQSNGDIPDVDTPDVTVTNDITTGTSNIGKYYEETMNNVGNSYIESGIKSFVMKLTRDVSNDDYGGTFQLIGIKIYQ